MPTHEIKHINPVTYYPDGTMAYKCKGAWIWLINGEPFVQAPTLGALLAAYNDAMADE